WLSEHDLDKNAAQLGSFTVYLWRFGMNMAGQGNSYSTICAKLCAVRWYHRYNLGYDPGVNASHALLLRGIRRFTNPDSKQHPLSPKLLRRASTMLDFQQPRNMLAWGGMLLAYFFLLRRSEYLFIGRRHHDYILRLGDICFLDNQNQRATPRKATRVGIRLCGAKNNQFGREELRYHQKSGDSVLCPVRAARWILKAAAVFGTHLDQPALTTGQ
ncbi:hypothetical protein PHYSODRAFT_441348, partial [Phytophthora sojae]